MKGHKIRYFCAAVAAATFVGTAIPLVGVTAAGNKLTVMPSTTQIRLEQTDLPDYGDNLAVSLAKNEREAVQMIVTPSADIKHYQIAVSDLKTAGGDVMSKDCVDVQVAKYINVVKPSLATFAAGYYPDALVPYAKIRAAGEDRIKKGNNQSFWFEVYAEKNQAAGVYEGTVTFVLNNELIERKLTVEVYDFVMPDEVSAKSSFLIWDNLMMYGHEEVNDELLEKYYEFLIDYKIAPNQLPLINMTADVQKQANDVYNCLIRPEVPSLSLPYRIIKTGSDSRMPGYAMNLLDLEHMEKLLVDLVNLSSNENNIFDKLYLYITELDEVGPGNPITNLAYVNQDFMKLKYKIAATDIFAGKEEVRESLKKVRLVSTIVFWVDDYRVTPFYMDRNPDSEKFGYGIDTWCLGYSAFEYTGGVRDRKNDGDGIWAYGCVWPKNPYPSYHLDDNLISPRTVGWYMKDFGIEGNLYWGSALYGKYTDEYRQRDIWGDPLLFPGANGDGYLIYPGDRYGVTALPTQRLLQIRDANEDYEYLTTLEKLYGAIAANAGLTSFDFNSEISYLYSLIYNKNAGTSGINKYYNDSERMIFARSLAATQIEMAADGLMFTCFNGVVKIYSTGAYVDSVNGSKPTSSVSGKGVCFTASITGGNPEIVYTALDGSTKTVSLYIDGGDVK